MLHSKYKKQFKGKIKTKILTNNKIIFGSYALKSIENVRLTSRQIEATRRVINRKLKKLGFLWIRVFPSVPVTKKPTENRMGKGKGSVSFWVARIKKGQILFEISGVSENLAFKLLKSCSNKLPVKTKIISSNQKGL